MSSQPHVFNNGLYYKWIHSSNIQRVVYGIAAQLNTHISIHQMTETQYRPMCQQGVFSINYHNFLFFLAYSHLKDNYQVF